LPVLPSVPVPSKGPDRYSLIPPVGDRSVTYHHQGCGASKGRLPVHAADMLSACSLGGFFLPLGGVRGEVPLDLLLCKAVSVLKGKGKEIGRHRWWYS
jgi:hypothetical protein